MNSAYNFNSSSSSFDHFLDLNEEYRQGHEQYGLTINHPVVLPHEQATACSSTCPTFFSLIQDYHNRSHVHGEYHQTQQKVDQKINVLVEGSRAGPASSYQPTDENITKDHMTMVEHENISTSTNDYGSMKWMSSKMRVIRKMMPSNNPSKYDRYIPAAESIYHNHNNQINSTNLCNSSTAEIVRVCSDCNTTKTPLWRGGPQGPKSLCNACGIRRRKARKAMALAEAAQNDTDIVKEKKPRTSCDDVTQSHQTTATSKLSFEDFAMSLMKKKSTEMFPRDEEEAAILLMALSYGLIHS